MGVKITQCSFNALTYGTYCKVLPIMSQSVRPFLFQISCYRHIRAIRASGMLKLIENEITMETIYVFET